MHVIESRLTCACSALAAILALGCGDSTAPAEATTLYPISRFSQGIIEITVSTKGATVDIDPDGYLVRVVDTWYVVGVNGTVTLRGIPKGKYSILLDRLAGNCSVTGINPSSVDVVPNQASSVSFSVSCTTKTAEMPSGPWDY